MTNNDLIKCPEDDELMDSLAVVMSSVAMELKSSNPNPYRIFSNEALGERLMQITEELQMIEGIATENSIEEFEKFHSLIQEVSQIGAEIKVSRKDA